MLVGVVIGGGKSYKSAGWDKNDEDNPDTWNYGTASWAIYAVSDTLKKQFPKGRNLYFGETVFPKTKIFLSVVKEATGLTIKTATNHQSTALYLCPATVFPCSPKTAGAEALSTLR